MKASNLFFVPIFEWSNETSKKNWTNKKVIFLFFLRDDSVVSLFLFCESGFLQPKVFEDVFVRSFDPKYFLVREKNLSFDLPKK
jgi:hypothetical protein